MLKGPGVYPLTGTFSENVGLCGGHHHPVHRLYAPGRYEADGYVQPYCDSPLDGEAVAESAYLNVLQHARDYVYIVTPYLSRGQRDGHRAVPCSQSGVDV